MDTSAYNAEQKEAAKAILAEAREAIDAAVTTEEADKALETALAALAEVEKLICASDLFTDVAQEAWYHKGVDFVVRSNYMEGMGNGVFGVNAAITRGQIRHHPLPDGGRARSRRFGKCLYRCEGRPVLCQSCDLGL